jgi:hypothetical protein
VPRITQVADSRVRDIEKLMNALGPLEMKDEAAAERVA